MPFSVLAIGAALEGKFDYDIVDGNAESDATLTLTNRVLQGGVSVFGMTVMPGPQLEDGYKQTQALRAAFPGLVTIWGGYFATEHPQTCVSSGLVDFCVRGHGEAAIVDLLTRLRAGDDPRDASAAPPEGIAYRQRDGRIRLGPVARVPNVESLPDFPFHKLDMKAYPRSTFLGSRTLGYHSSYGCPFLCNFCGVVSLTKGRWDAQSPERVERVMTRYVREWGVNAVEFYDNNFFTHEARCREIADRIAPLKLRWWGEGRALGCMGW